MLKVFSVFVLLISIVYTYAQPPIPGGNPGYRPPGPIGPLGPTTGRLGGPGYYGPAFPNGALGQPGFPIGGQGFVRDVQLQMFVTHLLVLSSKLYVEAERTRAEFPILEPNIIQNVYNQTPRGFITVQNIIATNQTPAFKMAQLSWVLRKHMMQAVNIYKLAASRGFTRTPQLSQLIADFNFRHHSIIQHTLAFFEGCLNLNYQGQQRLAYHTDLLDRYNLGLIKTLALRGNFPVALTLNFSVAERFPKQIVDQMDHFIEVALALWIQTELLRGPFSPIGLTHPILHMEIDRAASSAFCELIKALRFYQIYRYSGARLSAHYAIQFQQLVLSQRYASFQIFRLVRLLQNTGHPRLQAIFQLNLHSIHLMDCLVRHLGIQLPYLSPYIPQGFGYNNIMLNNAWVNSWVPSFDPRTSLFTQPQGFANTLDFDPSSYDPNMNQLAPYFGYNLNGNETQFAPEQMPSFPMQQQQGFQQAQPDFYNQNQQNDWLYNPNAQRPEDLWQWGTIPNPNLSNIDPRTYDGRNSIPQSPWATPMDPTMQDPNQGGTPMMPQGPSYGPGYGPNGNGIGPSQGYDPRTRQPFPSQGYDPRQPLPSQGQGGVPQGGAPNYNNLPSNPKVILPPPGNKNPNAPIRR